MSSFLKHLLNLTFLILFLGGCAGPGGGSPASGSLGNFDSKNTQEIVIAPYYLADPAQGGDHAWYMKLKITSKVPVAGFLKPNQMLTESLTRAIFALQPVPGKVLSSSPGSPIKGCEGSYSGQVSMKSSGDFKGSLSFSHYSDDCSLVLDGLVPFTGKIDMVSGEAGVSLNLPPLAARLAEKDLQLAGRMDLTFNAFKGEKQLVLARSSMEIADETGPRFSLRPVTFSWDRQGEYMSETIEGQFGVSPYGFVQVKTTSPIMMRPDSKKPFNGSLKFYDAKGRWIRLLFAKPGMPGFFRLDGDDGFYTIGHL
jgi:hypothetical protein